MILPVCSTMIYLYSQMQSLSHTVVLTVARPGLGLIAILLSQLASLRLEARATMPGIYVYVYL